MYNLTIKNIHKIPIIIFILSIIAKLILLIQPLPFLPYPPNFSLTLESTIILDIFIIVGLATWRQISYYYTILIILYYTFILIAPYFIKNISDFFLKLQGSTITKIFVFINVSIVYLCIEGILYERKKAKAKKEAIKEKVEIFLQAWDETIKSINKNIIESKNKYF